MNALLVCAGVSAGCASVEHGAPSDASVVPVAVDPDGSSATDGAEGGPPVDAAAGEASVDAGSPCVLDEVWSCGPYPDSSVPYAGYDCWGAPMSPTFGACPRIGGVLDAPGYSNWCCPLCTQIEPVDGVTCPADSPNLVTCPSADLPLYCVRAQGAAPISDGGGAGAAFACCPPGEPSDPAFFGQ